MPNALFVPLLWRGHSDELLRDVTLEWDGNRITNISSGCRSHSQKLPGTAVIPPLVNSHCHLEFSHLDEPLNPPLPFTEWIGKTMRARRENAEPARSIQQGWRESRNAGVGFLADVMTQPPQCYAGLGNSSPSIFRFREVIGLTDETVAQQRTSITENASSLEGLSPHAPFTVRPDLLDFCVETSRRHDIPLMMHLAETRAELEFLDSGTGEFVEMLNGLGLWQGPFHASGTKPLDLLKTLAAAPRVLLAHGNYLDEEEIDFLCRHPHLHIVYCPRTHAYFEHDAHPWRQMREAGINVALGTDGRGSNPDLSIWEEVRFLAERFPETKPSLLLQMATINGARALGLNTTLDVGGPARWTLLERRDSGEMESWEDLLQAAPIPSIPNSRRGK